jgi:ribosomal protein S13
MELFQIMDEVAVLRRNVADLQEQLNKAHKRIAELLEPSIDTLEEQLVRKVMVSRGLDPSNAEDIKEYWKDYHGIED